MDRNPHEIVTLDDQPEDIPSSHSGICVCVACEEAAWGEPVPLSYDKPPPKPMRIRYMELPGEINPNTNELATPFVIVFDRVTGGPLDLETSNAIALNTGARGVLAFEQEIQIGDD